jgi:hypothetical protein
MKSIDGVHAGFVYVQIQQVGATVLDVIHIMEPSIFILDVFSLLYLFHLYSLVVSSGMHTAFPQEVYAAMADLRLLKLACCHDSELYVTCLLPSNDGRSTFREMDSALDSIFMVSGQYC